MDWLLLVTALIQVESGGNNAAVGDDGKALGCLQIQQCVIDDVNEIYGTHYKHKQALEREYSVWICKLYLSYYGKIYTKRTGKQPTYEILARIWNGGPHGYKKSATYKYWLKVKEEIEDRR